MAHYDWIPSFSAQGMPRYGSVLLAGALLSGSWFGLGVLLAAFAGSAAEFTRLWLQLQGFPQLMVGASLALIASQGLLPKRVLRLLKPESRTDFREWLQGFRPLRLAIIVLVTVAGTASLVALGFPGDSAVRPFLWATCGLVCFLAGIATAHGIEVIAACRFLAGARVRVFSYSPGETLDLRHLARYSTNYALLLSVGYLFSVLATILPDWSTEAAYVRTVQVFWPVLYVPFCVALLLQPHLAYHRVIREEKDRLLESCQLRIQQLLSAEDIGRSDIERSNAWADLFERISETPDYAFDVGIALRTAIPVVANLLSLLPNKQNLGAWIRDYLANAPLP